MKSKNSILSLALTVGAILAVVSSGSATGSASRPASAAPERVGTVVVANPSAPLTPVGSGFTYQGSLKNGGSPANGQYDFQFTLYDALTGGNLVGGPVTTANVTVAGGLFTVTLDFGQSPFIGEARYLQIAVRQTGGGTYTTLTPRQPLTPAPYALSLKPGAVISGTTGTILTAINTGTGVSVYGNSATGYGVLGISPAVGVYGSSTTGYGVFGISTSSEGVRGETGSAYPGVEGNNTGTGPGVRGDSATGPGVYGFSSGNKGVWGVSTTNDGLFGTSSSSSGVAGISTNGRGVYGSSTNNEGVHGETNSNFPGVFGNNTSNGGIGPGVRGDSTSGPGVYGFSPGNKGVQGVSTSGDGVYGNSPYGNGVYGDSINGYGVVGRGTNNIGVYGESTTGWAGWFEGNVNVTGSCCAAAEGSFKIDHPLDPANKYLVQSAVQSEDMMSVYNGNITTDARGDAVVTLPSYFEALNKDFRYQLTVMGQFAQAIVSTKIKDNRFSIKTDKPNVEVSWQVTGIRKDAYAEANRVPVEVDKLGDERGKYLHPEAFGQPESKGIGYEQQQAQKDAPKPPDAKP